MSGIRLYSKRAFWTVKVLMIVLGFLYYGEKCEQYGEAKTSALYRAKYKGIQYQDNELPYCWYSGIYPIREFDSKNLTVKIKRQ